MTTVATYRTALVTGASRGIGAAIARALAGRDLQITAVARSADSLADLVRDIGCEPLALDLANPAEVADALGGRDFDVVVNNAGGLARTAPFHEIPMAEIASTLDVNLTGTLAVSRALLPGMVHRRNGHIFFISSMFGPNPAPNVAVYAASKAAIRAFCRSLRLDLAGTNVRVTEIAPGRVETDFFRDAMGGDMSRVRSALYSEYRALQPADVAQALLAALDLPPHADACLIELTPTDQALGGATFAKKRAQ